MGSRVGADFGGLFCQRNLQTNTDKDRKLRAGRMRALSFRHGSGEGELQRRNRCVGKRHLQQHVDRPRGIVLVRSVASLTMRCERLIDQPAVRMMALTDVLGQPKNSIALHQRRMALPRECPGRGAAGAPRAALGPQITRRAMDADPWECEKCSA